MASGTTDKSEHRGWELETEYNPHPMDDPEFEFTDTMESGPNGFLVAMLIIGGILLGGQYLLEKYWEPPKLNFPTPVFEIATVPAPKPPEKDNMGYMHGWGPIPKDWHYQFLKIDAQHKVVRGYCQVYADGSKDTTKP